MKVVAQILVNALVLGGLACDRRAHPSPTTAAPERSRVPDATVPRVAGDAATVVLATDLPGSPAAVAGLSMTFDADTAGGPANGVESVIGDWLVAERDGIRGLMVDGSRWRSGTPSANLADQARRLYGGRYAEFLDGVRAFAYFPLAIVQAMPPEGDVRMSVRFYAIAGQIDQAAGIAFGIQSDGSYYCVRANALEDNLLWARVVRGRRTIIDTIRGASTPTRTWHALVVTLRGRELGIELDGESRFRRTVDEVPRGRVGLWSKADSQVLFDDLRVEHLPVVAVPIGAR